MGDWDNNEGIQSARTEDDAYMRGTFFLSSGTALNICSCPCRSGGVDLHFAVNIRAVAIPTFTQWSFSILTVLFLIIGLVAANQFRSTEILKG